MTVQRSRIGVFVLDDEELVRRGLEAVLSTTDDLTLIGEADTVGVARRRIPASHPDVAILGMRLPDGSGLNLCSEVRTASPEVRCIVLAPRDDDLLVDSALMAGASAVLPRDVRAAALTDTIRAVAAGQSPLEGRLTQNGRFRAMDLGPGRAPVRLSEREHQILSCLSKGMTNREIAEQLGIREKTVANGVSGLLAKLGVRRRTQAAVLSASVGMGLS